MIFTDSSKIAERGGFAHDDTNVALVLWLPGPEAETLQSISVGDSSSGFSRVLKNG